MTTGIEWSVFFFFMNPFLNSLQVMFFQIFFKGKLKVSLNQGVPSGGDISLLVLL